VYQFEWEKFDHNHIRFVGFDADRKPIGAGEGTSRHGDSYGGTLSTSAAAATIDVVLMADVQTVEYPFELQEIPLVKHEQMPERLEPLKFSGEVPADIEFLEFATNQFNFKEVRFRVSNRANKNIRMMELEVAGLDAAGKELEKFNHEHLPDDAIGGERAWQIAPANGSASIAVSAFFLPEETSQVQAKVLRMEFTDATQWP
jgi:hypothetical protein